MRSHLPTKKKLIEKNLTDFKNHCGKADVSTIRYLQHNMAE